MPSRRIARRALFHFAPCARRSPQSEGADEDTGRGLGGLRRNLQGMLHVEGLAFVTTRTKRSRGIRTVHSKLVT